MTMKRRTGWTWTWTWSSTGVAQKCNTSCRSDQSWWSSASSILQSKSPSRHATQHCRLTHSRTVALSDKVSRRKPFPPRREFVRWRKKAAYLSGRLSKQDGEGERVGASLRSDRKAVEEKKTERMKNQVANDRIGNRIPQAAQLLTPLPLSTSPFSPVSLLRPSSALQPPPPCILSRPHRQPGECRGKGRGRSVCSSIQHISLVWWH